MTPAQTDGHVPAAGRRLAGRLVALGVTGSIAAYKAVELLRLLTRRGGRRGRPPLPVRGPVRRAAQLRRPVAAPGRDRGHGPPARRADRAHRHRRQRRRDRRGAGDRPLPRRDGERHGRRRHHGGLPRELGAGRRGAGHGRRHVDAPGDPGERRPAARRLRLLDRRPGQRTARLRPVRGGPPRRARRTSSTRSSPPSRIARSASPMPRAARRSPPPRRARPTSPGATSSSPPAAPASRSTRSASSATARPGRWASRSPRRPSIVARP